MFDAIFPKHWTTLQRLMWLKTNALARAVYEIVTGNPVTFTAKSAPLRQLSVAFSPVQDLHGYDAPWPAGGHYNQWDEEWEEGAISWSGDNYGVANKIRSKGYIPVTPETTYYAATPANIQIFYYDANKTFVSYAPSSVRGTFSVPADCYYMRFYTYATDSYPPPYKNDIAINYPATVTKYSPYSNLCPISGWSSLHVYDDPLYAGVIEWNQLIQNGNFADGTDNWNGGSYATLTASDNKLYATATAKSTYAYINATTVKPTWISGHKYYLQAVVTIPSADKIAIGDGTAIVYNQNVPANERTVVAAVGNGQGNRTGFTIYSGRTTGLAVGDTITIEDVMLCDLTEMFGAGNEPATVAEFRELFPLDYYAYNAGTETLVGTVNGMDTRTISISLGDTYYSGYVDVVTGVVKARPYFASYNGETLVGPWMSSMDKYVAGATPTVGAQVVDMGGTETTIQLTPQEVQSLLGENVLFSDANGNLTVEYRSN